MVRRKSDKGHGASAGTPVRTYVLDTNVLLQDPIAMFKFEEHNVVLPMAAVEELDKLKTYDGEIGYSAREAARNLESLRLKGNITEGIPLDSGGTFRIETDFEEVELPGSLDVTKADNDILKVAYGLNLRVGNTVLVSKDVLVRVKAGILGIDAEDYRNEMVDDDALTYTGRRTFEVSANVLDEFLSGDGISREDASLPDDILDNEFITLVTRNGKTAYGRYRKEADAVAPLFYAGSEPFGVKARNAGQQFAVEALMQPASEIPLVIMKGPAGTAKTFLSMACGLEQVTNSGHIAGNEEGYRKLLITRANVAFDNDIGALPGTEEEKVSPLLRGCLDNLELLIDAQTVKKGGSEDELQDKVDELFDRGWIDIQALGFLRGRSVTRQFVVIDEAQNTSPNQMLGILTRAGEGTKIVICGDLDQIDNTRLDRHTNGLAFALEKMAGSRLCAIVGFDQTECTRSPLAQAASDRMGKGSNGRNSGNADRQEKDSGRGKKVRTA